MAGVNFEKTSDKYGKQSDLKTLLCFPYLIVTGA